MTGVLFPLFPGLEPAPMFKTLEEQAASAECWETDPWAARSILEVELLTQRVLDPCCGTGILTLAARAAGYIVHAMDLCDWQFDGADDLGVNFLDSNDDLTDITVFMNPPFSQACEFVDHARARNARKIVCFQRASWRESDKRREWWFKNPPSRTWICGDRASCWLFTIPMEERKGGTNVAHSFYVWERGHNGAELQSAIYRQNSRRDAE